MSSIAVGIVIKHYPGAGGELVLAICLADEASRAGGNIAVTVPELAQLSRMSEKNVQRLLRKMLDAGWLQRVQMSAGGRGCATIYQIDPAWLANPEKVEPKVAEAARNHGQNVGVSDEKPGTKCRGFRTKTGDKMSGFSDRNHGQNVGVLKSTPYVLNNKTPPSPPNTETGALQADQAVVENQLVQTEQAEIRKLGQSMLDRIRRINPKFSEPSWRSWDRDIRRMVQCDGRTLREIGELFVWANADAFWQTNILSPGKLRKQWDTLTTRRAKQPGKASIAPVADRQCKHHHHGQRCTRPGTIAHDGGYLCVSCYQDISARRAA